MAQTWLTCSRQGAPGVIWMDPDIAADPDDHNAMLEAISYRDDTVWVAAHKLWPASTGRQEWVWGHGRWDRTGPVMSQQFNVMPGWFAMGMTYTPSTLLHHVVQDLMLWTFGAIDMSLSHAARQLGVPIRVARKARPKHLHYIPRTGDVGYRPCS